MERDESTNPDDLLRPEGNGLEANYEKHDVGEQHVIEALQFYGYTPLAWGIDMRHDDGEGLVYDERMDLLAVHGDKPTLAVEVKVKTHEDWMFCMNERHWENYNRIGYIDGLDAYVVFCHVIEADDGEVTDIDEVWWVPVEGTTVERRFRFPDGNKGVAVEDEHAMRADDVLTRMQLTGQTALHDSGLKGQAQLPQ